MLESTKKAAISELKVFIQLKAREVEAYGWRYHTTDNAPETFSDLKERTVNRNIPIATAGNDQTIYGPTINTMFRFWHDVNHLELDQGFSLSGELAVIKQHLKEGQEFGLSHLALRILEADTKGQVLYYFKHKRFVKNQSAFIDTCLQLGINRAVRFNH